MRVKEIMSHPVATVTEDTTLEAVARLLIDQQIGGAPVVDVEGRLVGIITESDFAARERGFPFSTFRFPQVLGQWMPPEGLEEIYKAARTTPASAIMSTEVATIAEDEPLEEVVRRMVRHDLRRIVVVRDDRPVGIVTRHDLMRVMLGEAGTR